jgi:ABC-2 type transport system permease protein
MKPLIKWGLWQRRWSIMWWSIGVLFFIFFNLIFYPSVRDQATQYNQIVSQIPQGARGLISDTADILSPTGYLSSQIFYSMLPLLLGFLAISLGSSLIGREEKEGTVELLLGRPISRAKLIVSKTVLGLIVLLGVGLIGVLSTAIMAKLVSLAVPFKNIVIAGLVCMMLALSWGAIAFMITMLGRGARSASIAVATLVAIAGYILTSLTDTAKWLVWPARFFPFHYYHPGEILNGIYHWQDLLFMTAVIVVCAVISVVAFRRRDITSN